MAEMNRRRMLHVLGTAPAAAVAASLVPAGAAAQTNPGAQAPAATPEAPKKTTPASPASPSGDGAAKTEEKTKTAPTSNATKLTP